MKLHLQFRIQLLTDEDRRRIHEAAIRVLRRVPFTIQGTDEFFDYLSRGGCRIEGEKVWITDPQMDQVLDRLAALKRANESRPSYRAPTEISAGSSGQGLTCCDVRNDRLRPATAQDLADWSRLVDAIPGLQRYHPTFIPQDVPKPTCDLHTFALIALNSARLWPVSVYNEKSLPYFYEIAKVVKGEEEARRDPGFNTGLWVNSPFRISAENVRIALKARELLGRPIQPSTMPVAGVATPVTLAGATVQNVAEALGLNAFTLAVDGRVIGLCANPCALDMRTGSPVQSGPDADLLRLAVAEMNEFYTGAWPAAGFWPTTTAQTPGAQAMMEKALGMALGVLTGMRRFGALGTLATTDVGSPVQLMLDVEMWHWFQRFVDGVEVDEERLAEEVIAQVAPQGARFLEQPHTAQFFRTELWTPELLDRRLATAWIRDPQTMVDRARAKALRLLAEAPNQCPLSGEQRRAIRAIVAEADREIVGS